ncbi:hypothetical protein ACI789_16705 [Geodermatophilus sp. SYSU D00965]
MDIWIDNREPVAVEGIPDDLVRQIEDALRDGTVLRLDVDQGVMLINGTATSTVLVAAHRRPATAEARNT